MDRPKDGRFENQDKFNQYCFEEGWSSIEEEDFFMEYDAEGTPIYDTDTVFVYEEDGKCFDRFLYRSYTWTPPPLSRWKRLVSIWTRYFRFSIQRNDKFIVPMLLSVVSSHAPIFYNIRGTKRYTRFHLLILQRSGTGKSQSMNVIHRLLDSLERKRKEYLKLIEEGKMKSPKDQFKDEILHQHITQITDAALVGSIIEVRERGKSSYVPRYGALHSKLFVSWDEGGEMFKQRPYNEQLLSLIQSAVDEPGKVSKSLSHGTIEYEPKSTIVAGSYVTPEIRSSVWKSGFAQRFFCIFSEYSVNEINNIVGEVIQQNIDNVLTDSERKKIEEEVAKLILEPSDIEIFHSPTNRLEVINNTILPFFEKEIDCAFVDDDKQQILNSFKVRWMDLIDKAAVNISFIEKQKFVKKEYYQEAFEICKQSLIDVKNFIRDKPEEVKEESFKQRFNITKQIFQLFPGGISTYDLMNEIEMRRKKGLWTLGVNSSREFILECWSKGLIKKYTIPTSSGKGKKFIWKLPDEDVKT